MVHRLCRRPPEKTAQRFTADGRWYLTGDAGQTDEDGFFFFSARDDDVIIMAGYRIGPFDVESVLVMHDEVVEAAVVGMPDELRGEVLEAFVVLRDGVDGTDELEVELQTLVKKKFAAHAYPRTVHFVPQPAEDPQRQGAALPAPPEVGPPGPCAFPVAPATRKAHGCVSACGGGRRPAGRGG